MDTSLIDIAQKFGLPGLMLLGMGFFILWVMKQQFKQNAKFNTDRDTERQQLLDLHRQERDEWRKETTRQADRFMDKLNDILVEVTKHP